MRVSKLQFYSYLVLAFLAFSLVKPVTWAPVVFASETDGTIDSSGIYAWLNNSGWINFGLTEGDVHVTDAGLTGYAWSANDGWINLNPTLGGVTNDAEGNLGGWAWDEQLGWINFSGVIINSSGKFTGQTTATTAGIITFDCNFCNVQTDWRPASVRSGQPPPPTPSPIASSPADSGGGSGGNEFYPPPSSGQNPTSNPPPDNIHPANEIDPQCEGYKDLNSDDPDCPAFKYAHDIGAITGNPDHTVKPGGRLQRDQAAKIILLTFQLYDGSNNYCHGRAPFPDVETESWASSYICRGVALKIITGYLKGADEGYYRPARAMNRVEFLALLLRNLKNEPIPAIGSHSYTDAQEQEWYSGYAKYAKDHQLFPGWQLFPDKAVTRRETAETLYTLHLQGKI